MNVFGDLCLCTTPFPFYLSLYVHAPKLSLICQINVMEGDDIEKPEW